MPGNGFVCTLQLCGFAIAAASPDSRSFSIALIKRQYSSRWELFFFAARHAHSGLAPCNGDGAHGYVDPENGAAGLGAYQKTICDLPMFKATGVPDGAGPRHGDAGHAERRSMRVALGTGEVAGGEMGGGVLFIFQIFILI